MDRKKVFKNLPDNIKKELLNAFNEGLDEDYEEQVKFSKTIFVRRKMYPCAIGIKFNKTTKKLDIRAYEHIMDINKYNDDVLIVTGEKEWLKE